jgi:hypothetical protein
MKKIAFLLLFTCFFSTFMTAQTYQSAIGLRVSSELGLTFQQHIGKNYTIEALLTTRAKEYESKITLLLEKHQNVLGRGFNFYYGAGGHKGFLRSGQPLGYEATFGVDAIGGVEFSSKQFTFSADYHPVFNLSKGNAQSFYNGYAALSVRYILIKRDTRFQEWRKKQKRRLSSKS